MLWHCDECQLEHEADPAGHTDYGGVIKVYGPECPVCGGKMTFVEDLADRA